MMIEWSTSNLTCAWMRLDALGMARHSTAELLHHRQGHQDATSLEADRLVQRSGDPSLDADADGPVNGMSTSNVWQCVCISHYFSSC